MKKQEYIKNQITQYYKNKSRDNIIVFNYIKRRNNNVIYQIIDNISRRTYEFLKRYDIVKTMTYMQLIGCTEWELKKHLERQLKDGMTFENYGKWEIDHIKAITLYNLNNEYEMLECFNYKNLQPLWREDNIKKSNKIVFDILDVNPKGGMNIPRDV